MSVSDILEKENNRKEDSLDTIYLFREGTFYRAYNWSAWLIRNISCANPPTNGLTPWEPIRVFRKVSKSSNKNYAFVGFPLASLDKFIPKREKFDDIDDIQINIQLKIPEAIKLFEEYSKIEDWIMSVPLTNSDNKKSKKEKTGNKNLDRIIDEILSFPVENKTLLDSVRFLSQIRDDLSQLYKK